MELQNPRKDVPVEGGPGWLASDYWEIQAKAESPASPEMMRGPMLEQLLEDRFLLKLHRETRQVPIYALTVAKNGLKVQPEKRACAPSSRANRPEKDEIQCGSSLPRREGSAVKWDLTMGFDQFSKRLNSLMDRPVVNQAEVDGLFIMHLEFAPDAAIPGLSVAHSECSRFPISS